jgi:hypothetical protein
MDPKVLSFLVNRERSDETPFGKRGSLSFHRLLVTGQMGFHSGCGRSKEALRQAPMLLLQQLQKTMLF